MARRLRESAFLLKGLKITLTDKRAGQEKEEVFQFENGIKDFVGYLNEDKDTLGQIMYFDGKQDGVEVEVAAQYNDGYSENVLSFVNNVRTPDGERMKPVFAMPDQNVQRLRQKSRSAQGTRQESGRV